MHSIGYKDWRLTCSNIKHWTIQTWIFLFFQASGLIQKFLSTSDLLDRERMKVIYENCGLRNEYESDLRRNEHNLSSTDNKTWKKFQPCTGFEPMKKWIYFQN